MLAMGIPAYFNALFLLCKQLTLFNFSSHQSHPLPSLLLFEPKLPPLPFLIDRSSSSPFLHRQSSPPSPSVSWSDSRGHLSAPSVVDHRPPLALLGLHSEAAPHLF